MNEHLPFPFLHEWMSEMDVSLAENLRRWAENEVMARRLELKEDYQGLLEPAMRKLFQDIGLQRLLWPEEYGGDGHNHPSAAITITAALEQVARGTWASPSSSPASSPCKAQWPWRVRSTGRPAPRCAM
jgi:alkylation response protein AidB-like acyl-CoA dehydrogenase